MIDARTANEAEHKRVMALCDDIRAVIQAHALKGVQIEEISAALGHMFNQAVLKHAIGGCICGSPDHARGDRDDLLAKYRKIWDDGYKEDHATAWEAIEHARKVAYGASGSSVGAILAAIVSDTEEGEPFKASTLDDVISDLLRGSSKAN